MSNSERQFWKPSRLRHSFVLIPWLAGCALLGGGGEGSWQRAEGYTVQAPQDWKSQNPETGDRAFRLPSKNVVTITSSCNKHPDASLKLLTKHLLIGTRGVTYETQEPITIPSGEALFSHVNATIDKRPFQLLLVVAKSNGCVFDFSLVSPKKIPTKEKEDFLAFVRTFKHGTN